MPARKARSTSPTKRAPAIGKPPRQSSWATMNEFVEASARLVKAGKLEQAAALFIDYYEAGKPLCGSVVQNGLYPYTAGLRPSARLVALLPELITRSFKDRNVYAEISGAMTNLGLVVEKVPAQRAHFLACAAPRIQDPHRPELHAQLLSHAMAAKDKPLLERLRRHIDKLVIKGDRKDYFDDLRGGLEAMVLLHAERQDMGGALPYLIRLAHLGPADTFARWHRHKALLCFRNAPEFEVLFAAKEKGGKKLAATRGLELIARVKQSMGKPKAKPLSRKRIEAMSLAEGARIPPSLAAFLEFSGPPDGVLDAWPSKPLRIQALIASAFADPVASIYDLDGLAERLPGWCYPLSGDLPLSFLYLGKPDDQGDYPVLTLFEDDDGPQITVAFPGIDVYLACATKAIGTPRYYGGLAEDPTYGPSLRAVIRANFRPQPKRQGKRFVFELVEK